MRRFVPFLLLLAAGCGPDNVTVTGGSYTAFLAQGSSQSLVEGKLEPLGAETSYAVDCRNLEEGQSRLEGALDICDDPATWPPEHEGWMTRDGFYVMSEPLAPWRSEAIVTSEGDVQFTFHQHLPGGEDFRFAFVVDPQFQPVRCVQDEEGAGTKLEPVDGDWLENWSAGADGTVFFLNSGAYQFNPSNTEQVWALPQEWRAGYARAKFAAEDAYMRSVRYGLPAAYSSFETDEGGYPASGDLFYSWCNGQEGLETRIETVAEEIGAEYELAGMTFTVATHGNAWRTCDEQPSGLDGWGELHYNWVRFAPGSELAVGGAASGEFHLTFDAAESQTRVFVEGTFETDRIKKDHWVTKDIEAEKLEENETVLCE